MSVLVNVGEVYVSEKTNPLKRAPSVVFYLYFHILW